MKRSLPLWFVSAFMLSASTQSWADTPPAPAGNVQTTPTIIKQPTGTQQAPTLDPVLNNPSSRINNNSPITAESLAPVQTDNRPPYPTTKRRPRVPRPLPVEKPQPKSMIEKQKEWIEQNKNVRDRTELPDLTTIKVETRACGENEIVGGMWKMIYYREDPPRRADRFNKKMKYQYLTYGERHFYGHIKTAKLIDDQKKAENIMKNAIVTRPGAEQKFLLQGDETKSEIISLIGKTAYNRQSCSIVVKPSEPFVPGDLILIGYTPRKSTLYELYRRWF